MRKGEGRLAVLASTIVIVVLGIYNMIYNPSFWNCSFANCLTLLVAVFISFFLVQKRADRKNQKDALVKLLNAIQDLADTKDAYEVHENDDPNTLTMRKRQLSNYAGILKKNADQFGITDEATFINDKVEEYADFLGNHIDDLNYLSHSAKDLRRPLELRDSKIYEIIFKLYG